MKCAITYFDDTEGELEGEFEGELVLVGAWEVVVVVTLKEEVGVMLNDGPADELRASTGLVVCTAGLQLELRARWWLEWFMRRANLELKGEARERAAKERTMSGKCTSIAAGDTMSQRSVK